jgi:hypothetical protein
MAVVCAITAGTARDPSLMHLQPIFVEEHHIPGVDNTAADALSRNIDFFLTCSPQVAPDPSTTGRAASQPARWTSPSWRVFLNILGKC